MAARSSIARGRTAAWAGHDRYDIWERQPWRCLYPPPAGPAQRLARAAALRAATAAPRILRRVWGVQPRVFPETLVELAAAATALGEADSGDLVEAMLAARVSSGEGWPLGLRLPGPVSYESDSAAITLTLKGYRVAAAAGRPGVLIAIGEGILRTADLETATGRCFPYVPGSRLYVHNANLAAAEMLADAGTRFDRPAWLSAARSALDYWLADAAAGSGFEYLGPESRTTSRIDHLHTAIVLQSLVALERSVGVPRDALARARASYLADFFTGEGIPCAPSDDGWVDGRTFGEAVRALVALGEHERAADAVAGALALELPGGGFGYRLRRRDGRVDRTRYLRWSEAPLTAALAEFARVCG